ncbi:DUF1080 domain-containing protein [bacterium]|nr:DUF1080 domain-containing protein [bacterium]
MRGFLVLILLLLLNGVPDAAAQDAPVVPPKRGVSQVIRLFDGETLTGWVGHEKFWSVEDGEIVGRNTDEVPVSTYLLTAGSFSDFRLTFETKLVTSEMHSGIALWGRVAPEHGDEFTYAGHLVMFPSNYGFWDLYGRNSIHQNEEKAKAAGKQHDWNHIEILAQGNRIRFVLNGELISDWREPEPERIQEGPIGLQLHSNKVPQEVRFRKLMLETFPEDRLVTLNEAAATALQTPTILPIDVPPNEPVEWTQYREAAVPDSLFAKVYPDKPFKPAGLGADEGPAFYAMLHKAAQTDDLVVRQSAAEFLRQRMANGLDGKFRERAPSVFPAFYDMTSEPALWQGRTVVLKGHVRKLVRVPAGENAYGIKEYWEAWLYSEQARNNPFLIVSLERDERMQPGAEVLIDNVSVAGWFFKLYGYQAQENGWAAPMVITKRLRYRPVMEPRGLLSGGIDPRLLAIVLTLAALGCWYAFRLWARLRIEDRERSELRSLVELNDPTPTFDNVVDNGGVLFPSEDAAGNGETSAGDLLPSNENKTTSQED